MISQNHYSEELTAVKINTYHSHIILKSLIIKPPRSLSTSESKEDNKYTQRIYYLTFRIKSNTC